MEIDRYKTLKDNLQLEGAELKEIIGLRDIEIRDLNESVVASEKATTKVEITVREQRTLIDKLEKEIEINTTKHAKLQDEFDAINFTLDKTKKQFHKMTTEFRSKEEEIAKLKSDYERTSKAREQSDKRIVLLEDQRETLRGENEKIRHIISQMERQVNEGKKRSDEYKRDLEKMTREKDILYKNMLRQQGVQRDQLKLIKIQQQNKRRLESEINNYLIEKHDTTKQIKYLEKERNRIIEEHLDLTKKIEDYMDEFKLKQVFKKNLRILFSNIHFLLIT